MVPLPRYSTVGGIPITELMDAKTIEQLVERTRNGGTEIVQLMQTGGAYYAPASSACLMVEAIIHNQSREIPAAITPAGGPSMQRRDGVPPAQQLGDGRGTDAAGAPGHQGDPFGGLRRDRHGPSLPHGGRSRSGRPSA